MVKPRELSFKTLCDFFAAVAAARSTKRKALLLRSLLDKNLERTRDDVYDVIRLVLPRVLPAPLLYACADLEVTAPLMCSRGSAAAEGYS